MPYSLNNDDIRGGACDVWADLSFMKPLGRLTSISPRLQQGDSGVSARVRVVR